MKLRPRTKGLSRILSPGVWGAGLSSLVFLFLALLLFFFSAVRPDGLQSVRAGLTDMTAPVLGFFEEPIQAAADYVRSVSGLKALQAENARLQDENKTLREWYQTAQILKSENDSLRQLLNISLPPGKSYVTARVIADAGNAYVKTALALAGTQAGIAKGQAALAGDGMIGRVVEVGNHTARILLLTDINSRIPVLVEGSNDNAILAGSNADTPELIHLPPTNGVRDGARVITSGHGGYFPFGLPIGVTVKAPDGHWMVRPFADPDHAAFVRIVNGGDDPDVHGSDLP